MIEQKTLHLVIKKGAFGQRLDQAIVRILELCRDKDESHVFQRVRLEILTVMEVFVKEVVERLDYDWKEKSCPESIKGSENE